MAVSRTTEEAVRECLTGTEKRDIGRASESIRRDMSGSSTRPMVLYLDFFVVEGQHVKAIGENSQKFRIDTVQQADHLLTTTAAKDFRFRLFHVQQEIMQCRQSIVDDGRNGRTRNVNHVRASCSIEQ